MIKPQFAVIPFLLFLIVAVAGPLSADDDTRVYVPIGSVDLASVIDPPPAVGSAALDEQMDIVLWLQKTRTPEQVAFVQKTLDVERFAPVLGDALFSVDGIELKLTIDDAIDEVRREYDAYKALYDLPRPFVINDQVHPATDARPVASYPSGHATRAIVYARLLAEIFPDHHDALMELAEQVGYGRVIAGVHYPIDVTAGQALGNAFVDVIVEQPQFRAAVERIKGLEPPTRVAEGAP